MKQFLNFGFRANIETFTFRGKRVFIYNDHRTILNAIFFALKNGFIKQIPNVFYFDYHDDACNPKPSLILKAQDFNIKKCTEEDFNSIVEFEMGIMDDDWVKTGMEFNLINNSVSIGTEKYNTSHEIYIDNKGINHDVICISHLSSALSSRGELGDSIIKEPYFKRVRELFDYNNGHLNHFGENTAPFVLDFDLDCFAAEFRSKLMAWPEKMFIEELKDKTGFHLDITPLDFIDKLIDRCEFITICLEPGCCGGYGESFKVLSYLDKYIFEGILKTSTAHNILYI
ncbi:hypothetical protein [Roseimarinus sediminis]|uniref:hypothetical protein n=1 Tax=Roseimarinus sediminis TaxID=1610899 RepID=UPI003D1A6131